MPLCHSCNKGFANWDELALHILATKKGHRKGKKWAAKYMALNGLSAKAQGKYEFDRTPLTEEDRANKEDTRMRLSGITQFETTTCPKCKDRHRISLEAEFATSPVAWRIGGNIAKICQGCGG